MRHPASIALAAALMLTACNENSSQHSNVTSIKVQSQEQVQLHQLRRVQPCDRPQARNLRCGLYLQAGDRRWLCRDLEEPGYLDGSVRSTNTARRATGRSSQVPMAAPRSVTARTYPGAAFPIVMKEHPKGSFTKLK